MTTINTSGKTPKVRQLLRLPDIPQREPDEVTQYDQLFHKGLSAALIFHLGNPETTLVAADRWVVPDTDFDKTRGRYPDLLVAFGVDPELYRANNGYIVSEQGKAPDFVLEVASESTAEADVGVKQEYYESLGIGEYWRFDQTPTGQWHGARLAGDRLVDGRYEPIEIEELPGRSLQGYSPTLNLYLRWEQGELAFYDPDTGRPLPTLEDERRGRIMAESRAEVSDSRANAAEARADNERESRLRAEARNRELEEELRRLRGG